jgi:L-asparaginase
MTERTDELPKIAVFSGPTATIQNSPPLVTSNKAREALGLPSLTAPGGQPLRFDSLRSQRLAAPATVYVEAHSAHPLEDDVAELYGPPDGWLDEGGTLHVEPLAGAKPVYRVDLAPEDGLYLLPYMAVQANGQPWDDATAFADAPQCMSRQTFYPDASRIYEEIDRFGVSGTGDNNLLSRLASFDFFRPIPSSGYTKGRSSTSGGDGGIEPEVAGEDFFAYFPRHLRSEPSTVNLARGTNMVQRALATGDYVGAQWLEGSPTVEESLYWLDLMIDTRLPIVGHAAQRPHNTLGSDGDHNIVTGVEYIVSEVWADESGANRVGSVVIVDQLAFSAREVAKTDARPGNYAAVGGHGGVVASFGGGMSPPRLTFIPVRKHTYQSEVNLTRLPHTTCGVGLLDGRCGSIPVAVKSDRGELIGTAMPRVSFEKYGRYRSADGPADQTEPGIAALIADNLGRFPLAGFVAEGMSPYGAMTPVTDRALTVATFSGMPVARVGRGNTAGDTPRMDPLAVAGSNLTATKARLLLMACLLRFGAPPPATDPEHPSDAEVTATRAHLARYQEVFDSH